MGELDVSDHITTGISVCFPTSAAVGADLYLDDAPDNITALREKGHTTIVFTNSTNRGLRGPRADTWEEVEELVLAELKKWRATPAAKKPLAGR
jgi:5'(3')-deoxyribonucleotidase